MLHWLQSWNMLWDMRQFDWVDIVWLLDLWFLHCSESRVSYIFPHSSPCDVHWTLILLSGGSFPEGVLLAVPFQSDTTSLWQKQCWKMWVRRQSVVSTIARSHLWGHHQLLAVIILPETMSEWDSRKQRDGIHCSNRVYGICEPVVEYPFIWRRSLFGLFTYVLAHGGLYAITSAAHSD